jgi:sulfur carrier protein
MSTIKVNGKEQALVNPLSVSELIALNKVVQPDMVSVQLNGEFVNREDFNSIQVNAGDEIDFLFFMGGGGK